MDEQKVREAIEVFQGHVKWLKCIDDKGCEDACSCCVKYFETAIEALEKQLPKKPKEMKYKPLRDSGWKYECPTCRGACGENVYHYDITKDEMYCTTCGQRLDWSE